MIVRMALLAKKGGVPTRLIIEACARRAVKQVIAIKVFAFRGGTDGQYVRPFVALMSGVQMVLFADWSAVPRSELVCLGPVSARSAWARPDAGAVRLRIAPAGCVCDLMASGVVVASTPVSAEHVRLASNAQRSVELKSVSIARDKTVRHVRQELAVAAGCAFRWRLNRFARARATRTVHVPSVGHANLFLVAERHVCHSQKVERLGRCATPEHRLASLPCV